MLNMLRPVYEYKTGPAGLGETGAPHFLYQYRKGMHFFYLPPSLQNASGVVSNIARSSPGLHKYKEIRLFTRSNVHVDLTFLPCL
jgi:hypothetical protein